LKKARKLLISQMELLVEKVCKFLDINPLDFAEETTIQ